MAAQQLDFGCGMTCWHQLRDWNNAGVWQRLHEVLLAELRAADKLDMFRAVVASSHVRGSKAAKTGRSPVDRGRPGSKHYLITDAGGVPLAVLLTGGNRNDVTQLLPLLQAMPLMRGIRRQPRPRASKIYADRLLDRWRLLQAATSQFV